jgi:hypothetical protein
VRFKEFLQESVAKKRAYTVKVPVMFAKEVLPDGERVAWNTEFGEKTLVRVADVTDDEVFFVLAMDTSDENFTYVMSKKKFIRDTTPSKYDREWLNSLKEAEAKQGLVFIVTNEDGMKASYVDARFFPNDSRVFKGVSVKSRRSRMEWSSGTRFTTANSIGYHHASRRLRRDTKSKRDYDRDFLLGLKEGSAELKENELYINTQIMPVHDLGSHEKNRSINLAAGSELRLIRFGTH